MDVLGIGVSCLLAMNAWHSLFSCVRGVVFCWVPHLVRKIFWLKSPTKSGIGV